MRRFLSSPAFLKWNLCVSGMYLTLVAVKILRGRPVPEATAVAALVCGTIFFVFACRKIKNG